MVRPQYDHELIWFQPDEKIPEREQHTVQPENAMITTVWNPSGFYLIKFLPKGFKFNASYYVTQNLDPLSVQRGTQIGRTNRKLIVRADNTRPHTAKVTLDFRERNTMKRVPHPLYSPDLALSDFDLFGHVKQLLRVYGFADRKARLHAIEAILRGIEKSYWKTSFSTGRRESTNLVAPLENMWSKQTFCMNRISRP
jgi:hypothetical protein